MKRTTAALAMSFLLVTPAAMALDQRRDGQWRDGARYEQSDKGEKNRNKNRVKNGSNRFRGMDTNRDGFITRTEWRGNDQSFRNHDRNRDGVLSGAELRTGKKKK